VKVRLIYLWKRNSLTSRIESSKLYPHREHLLQLVRGLRNWLSRGWHWYASQTLHFLRANTQYSDIHHIEYNNVYTQNSNQMLMIKSNGGSGSVYSCSFNNFIGHSNAYTLDVNGYWSSISPNPGNGVLFYDMTFNNWKGTCSNGATRAPIQFLCPSGAPCYGMSVANFNVWTEAGNEVLYKCENAYGSGPCLSSGASHTAYAIETKTVTAAS